MSVSIKPVADAWGGFHGRRKVRSFPDPSAASRWLDEQRAMNAAERAASILPPPEAVIVLRGRR